AVVNAERPGAQALIGLVVLPQLQLVALKHHDLTGLTRRQVRGAAAARDAVVTRRAARSRVAHRVLPAHVHEHGLLALHGPLLGVEPVPGEAERLVRLSREFEHVALTGDLDLDDLSRERAAHARP